MRPLLSILIPTVKGREEKLHKLWDFLKWQMEAGNIKDFEVQITYYSDNKEISIGEKRRRLYEGAPGLFSWMIDDDDWTDGQAIKTIIDAIKKAPDADCIGFKELCIYNGKRLESSNFSLSYKEWADNFDGFNHVRTPFHKTPIRTELCRQAGVKDLRFGEDHEFAKDIYPILKKEIYIDEFIYHYRHNDRETHNEKYGITNELQSI
jgi:hypothetical protein